MRGATLELVIMAGNWLAVGADAKTLVAEAARVDGPRERVTARERGKVRQRTQGSWGTHQVKRGGRGRSVHARRQFLNHRKTGRRPPRNYRMFG